MHPSTASREGSGAHTSQLQRDAGHRRNEEPSVCGSLECGLKAGYLYICIHMKHSVFCLSASFQPNDQQTQIPSQCPVIQTRAGGTVSPGGRLVAHIQPSREGPTEKDARGKGPAWTDTGQLMLPCVGQGPRPTPRVSPSDLTPGRVWQELEARILP